MLSLIKNFDKIKYFICSDLKLINIICGINSCGANHPFPYCEVDRLQLFNGNANKITIGNIKYSASAFKKAGSNQKDAKWYDNCIFEPIIPGNDNTCILDICAPPELHLMQGIVKHIYDNTYKE